MDRATELAEVIRTRLLGIDPDEQDVVLDDDDWRVILDALAAKDTAISEMRAELEQSEAKRKELLDRCWRLNTRAEAAEVQLERARKALEPFLDMAGEMFARGWNAGNIVVSLDNPSDPHSIDAGHFFALRAATRALSQDEPAELGVGG